MKNDRLRPTLILNVIKNGNYIDRNEKMLQKFSLNRYYIYAL